MRYLLFLFIVFLCMSCVPSNSEIYIVPEGYVGYLVILYNQVDGQDAIYIDGHRAFLFPESGILKTKREPYNGLILPTEFYYSNISPKNRIKYVDSYPSGAANKPVAYLERVGSISRYDSVGGVLEFSLVLIGNKAQIDSLLIGYDNLDLTKLVDQ